MMVGIGDTEGMGAFEMGGHRPKPLSKKRDEDDQSYTTVMLRNIPNKYTRQMLIEQLHRQGFKGDIDYLYLPVDFANRCNVGYCFINLRTASARARFVSALHGVAAQTCLPGFNSNKVCQVTKAKWQGRDENIRRLRSGPELMEQLAAQPEWLPMLIDAEGNEEIFPIEDRTSTGLNSTRRQQMRKKDRMLLPGGPGFHAYGRGGGFPQGPMHRSPELAALSATYSAGFAAAAAAAAAANDGPRGRGNMMNRGGRRPRAGKGGFGDGGMGAMGPGGFRGMPGAGMPMMPVMTDQGFQYMPYDGAFEGGCGGGGCRFSYPSMGEPPMFGMGGMPSMPYAGYPGLMGWNPGMHGAGGYGGKACGGKGFAAMYGGGFDDDEEESEDEDGGF